MSQLWEQTKENLGFLLVCVLIVLGLCLLARLAERFFPDRRKVSSARRVSIVGICAAVATVLHMLDFSIPFLAPFFYKLDFSELPVLLCGFYLGPSAAVATEAIKILLKLLLKSTSTAFVGDFANFVVGCTFVLPATIWYHVHKSRHSAVIGLILGTVSMSVLGTLFNAVYLLPKFAQLYGISLEAIVAMGTAIHAGVSDVTSLMLACVLPLNILKGVLVSLLTLLLYKRVARPLFGLRP